MRYITILFAAIFLSLAIQCNAEEPTKGYYVTPWPDSHSWLKENGWLKHRPKVRLQNYGTNGHPARSDASRKAYR